MVNLGEEVPVWGEDLSVSDQKLSRAEITTPLGYLSMNVLNPGAAAALALLSCSLSAPASSTPHKPPLCAAGGSALSSYCVHSNPLTPASHRLSGPPLRIGSNPDSSPLPRRTSLAESQPLVFSKQVHKFCFFWGGVEGQRELAERGQDG